MKNPFVENVAVTLTTESASVVEKQVEGGKVSGRPDKGVDLRVPVRFGDCGVWFFTNQDARISNFRVAELSSQVFSTDGMTCLISRPGSLQRLTTRLGQEFDLAANAKISVVEDACVNSSGLFVAGLRAGIPTVSKVNGRGELQDSWPLGDEGDEIGWGSAGDDGYLGYLVGNSFLIKSPEADQFELVPGIVGAEKIFWLKGDGGNAFVLARKDGSTEFIRTDTREAQTGFKLNLGESLLRFDATGKLGRFDAIITTGPNSYRIQHI